MATWGGFDYANIIANRQKDTFIHGFLDISGNTIITNGDVSISTGNLITNYDASINGNVTIGKTLTTTSFINTYDASINGNVTIGKTLTTTSFINTYDASINGNLTIGKDILINGNLSVKQYQAQSVINTTTTNYQLIISEDISLNGRLFVSNDASFNGNCYVKTRLAVGTTTPQYTLDISSASTQPFRVGIVSEDLSLNGRLFVRGDASLNGNLTLANKGNLVIQNNSFARTFSPNSANANTGLTWNTTVGGDTINWSASASSVYPHASYQIHHLFDNNITLPWASSNDNNNRYTGNYGGIVSTTSITNMGGTTSLAGEWIQIRTTQNIPLILSNYQFATSSLTQFPKIYYILGSNDGNNWNGIHKGSLPTQPTVGDGVLIDKLITQQGLSPVTTAYDYTIPNYGSTGTLTITVYPLAGNSYSYFRLVITSIYTAAGVPDMKEWKINFTTAATSSSTLSLDKLVQNQFNVSSGATFTGSVGIGKSNPAYTLDVNGTVASKGTVGFRPNTNEYQNVMYYYWSGTQFVLNVDNASSYSVSANSDYRIKHNFREPQNILSRLCKLKLFDYQYKDIGIIKNDGHYRLGLFAHELQEMFPDYGNLVQGEKDGVDNEGEMIIQSITGETIQYFLLKAIQEQQQIIETQQSEIQDLKTQISTILSRLAALENK